jgi:hypothetical protein
LHSSQTITKKKYCKKIDSIVILFKNVMRYPI